MGLAAYLRHELSLRQARNPAYSLRAFGRDLGCDHATVSQWIRGQRPVSPQAFERVCARLGLGSAEAQLVAAFDPIDLDIMAATRGLPAPTAAKVAHDAGTSIDQVNISLSRLLRLGLLRMHGDRWVGRDEETR